MDPNVALARFLDACHHRCRDDALDALDDLRGWIERGGFLPQLGSVMQYTSTALQSLVEELS